MTKPTSRIDACRRCRQDFQQARDRGRPFALCPTCRSGKRPPAPVAEPPAAPPAPQAEAATPEVTP